MIAILLSLAAPLTPQAYLQQIDRTFVCPESLPDDEARKAATDLFVRQARAGGLNTVGKIVDFRYRMLERHRCTATLRKMRSTK